MEIQDANQKQDINQDLNFGLNPELNLNINPNIEINPEENQDNLHQIEKKNNEIYCKYCYKNFSRQDSLNRHLIGTCKVKKIEDEKKKNIFNNLLEIEKFKEKFEDLAENNKNLNENIKSLTENNKQLMELTEVLKKQNDLLNKKITEILKKNNKNNINKQNMSNSHNTNNLTNNMTNSNNTNNTNNTQNITNITISPLNAFGKENLKSIKYKDIEKIITDTKNTGKHCINRLVDLIHFNNNLPENQNIYMPDFNRGKFMVYDGNSWMLNLNEQIIIFDILEHIRKLYDIHNTDELEKKLEEPEFERKFNITFKRYFDFLFDEIDETELSPKEIQKKNEFKEMMDREIINKLYNNKKTVIENYKKYYQDNLIKLSLEELQKKLLN